MFIQGFSFLCRVSYYFCHVLHFKFITLFLSFPDLISEEDGCKVLHLKKQKVPLILEKSVGGYTYDTSDVAALRHRLQEEKASWLVYVVDAGQVSVQCIDMALGLLACLTYVYEWMVNWLLLIFHCYQVQPHFLCAALTSPQRTDQFCPHLE